MWGFLLAADLRLRFVGGLLLLCWLAGARADSPSHRQNQLEGEFQPELHHALASRADQRIARREVRRQARKAEWAAPLERIPGIDEA
jgi:hypothetical protein